MAETGLFHSTLEGSSSSAATRSSMAPSATSASTLKLRLHIAAVEVCFTDDSVGRLTADNLERNNHSRNPEADDSYEALCLRIGQAVFLCDYSDAPPSQPASTRGKPAAKVNVSFNELNIAERKAEQSSAPGTSQQAPVYRTILDFHSQRGAHVIFAPPQLDASIEYYAPLGGVEGGLNSSKLEVVVALEPMAVSFSVQQAMRWAGVLGRLAVGVAAEESANAFSMDLSVPQVQVLVRSDSATAISKWRELHRALNLQQSSEQWVVLPHGRHSSLQRHLGDGVCLGGYYFCIDELHLALLSGQQAVGSTTAEQTRSPQSLEMTRAALSVFVADWDLEEGLAAERLLGDSYPPPQVQRYLRAPIANASADSEGKHKVRISKAELPKSNHNQQSNIKSRKRNTAAQGSSSGSVRSGRSTLTANGSVQVNKAEQQDEEDDEGEDADDGYDIVSSEEEEREQGPGIDQQGGGRERARARGGKGRATQGLKGDDQLGPKSLRVNPHSVIDISAYMIELGELHQTHKILNNQVLLI